MSGHRERSGVRRPKSILTGQRLATTGRTGLPRNSVFRWSLPVRTLRVPVLVHCAAEPGFLTMGSGRAGEASTPRGEEQDDGGALDESGEQGAG